MWCRVEGFRPDDFWQQTPRHFQLAMRGVRKRMESEARAQFALAYNTGAFGALGYHGKLKKQSHYEGKKAAQTPREMAALIQSLGARSNMKIRRLDS